MREVLENGDFCHADRQDWDNRTEAVLAKWGKLP